MQYKILASDYDNTLVPLRRGPAPSGGGQGREEACRPPGGRFVLSTGRAYPVRQPKGAAGRHPVRTMPSPATVPAWWTREGTIVAEHPLTNEEMYALVDFCEDYNYPLQFNFRDACYAYCEYEYPAQGLRSR